MMDFSYMSNNEHLSIYWSTLYDVDADFYVDVDLSWSDKCFMLYIIATCAITISVVWFVGYVFEADFGYEYYSYYNLLVLCSVWYYVVACIILVINKPYWKNVL